MQGYKPDSNNGFYLKNKIQSLKYDSKFFTIGMLAWCLVHEEGKIVIHRVNEFPKYGDHFSLPLSAAWLGNKRGEGPIAYPVWSMFGRRGKSPGIGAATPIRCR